MNTEQAVAALGAIDSDPESGHLEADDIIQAAAHPEVAKAYEEARERCGGWWYA